MLRRTTLLLSAGLLLGLGLFLTAVSEILTPFLVGLVLAYLINPLVSKLQELGLPRPLAAAIPVAAAISLLMMVLVMGLPLLADQLAAFARRLPVYLMTLEHFVIPERLSKTFSLQLNADAVLRQLGVPWRQGGRVHRASLTTNPKWRCLAV
jgi:predicted PurR-regulated permease PerM